MFRDILTLLERELKGTFRSAQFLFAVLFVWPVVMVWLIVTFTDALESKSSSAKKDVRPARVGIVGSSWYLENELATNFEVSNNISEDPEKSVRSGLYDLVIVLPPRSTRSSMNQVGGDSASIEPAPPAQEVQKRLSVFYDGRRYRWLIQGSGVLDVLAEYQRLSLMERLLELGEKPADISFLKLDMVRVEGKKEGMVKLSEILPAAILFNALMIGLSAALDLVTERRKSQLLFPTLMTPVKRSAILLSTAIFTTLTALIPVSLLLIGIYLFYNVWMPKSSLMALSATSYITLVPTLVSLALSVPLILTISVLIVCFACLYSSIDQARGASMIFGVMVIAMSQVAKIPGIEPLVVYLVPVGNLYHCIEEASSGVYNGLGIALSLISSTLTILLLLKVIEPVFARDDLVTGYKPPVKFWLERGYFSTDLLSLLFIVLFLELIVSPTLHNPSALWGPAISSVLFFLIPTAVFLKLSRINSSLIMGLTVTHPMELAAVLLFGPLVAFFNLPARIEMYSAAMSESTSGSLLALCYGICIVPAFCQEMFQRGLILGFLQRVWTMPKLVVASGLLNCILGLSLEYAAINFIDGAVLGFVRLKTGSVWASILLRCFIGTAVILFASRGTEKIGFNFMVAAAVAALLGLRILSRQRKSKDSTVPSSPEKTNSEMTADREILKKQLQARLEQKSARSVDTGKEREEGDSEALGSAGAAASEDVSETPQAEERERDSREPEAESEQTNSREPEESEAQEKPQLPDHNEGQ